MCSCQVESCAKNVFLWISLDNSVFLPYITLFPTLKEVIYEEMHYRSARRDSARTAGSQGKYSNSSSREIAEEGYWFAVSQDRFFKHRGGY